MNTSKVSNKTKGRIGISDVEGIVVEHWDCGWQEYAAQNDDAIDGVIIMRRGRARPVDTGGMVYVQVKCGSEGYRQDQDQYPHHIGLQLGKAYIDRHRPRWERAPGPAVIVFVDESIRRGMNRAWWVDLREEDSYSPTNAGMILVPKANVFSHHTKGYFHRLCGAGSADRVLESIALERSDSFIPKLGAKESLRDDAWTFYKEWRGDEVSRNPALGDILVNRIGWKHITRRGRLHERIVQSWLLLGAAKRMVAECTNYYTLGRASHEVLDDGTLRVIDYVGLRANITFPHRHASSVQVVLRRRRLVTSTFDGYHSQKIWFYSVYELRRKLAVV